MSKILEVERKFTIHTDLLPKLGKGKIVHQGYFTKDPPVIRVSLSNSYKYKFTVKGPGTLARQEIEWEISESEAKALYLLAPFKITKTHYNLGRWHLNYFHDAQLWVAEIELKTLKEKIKLPEWIDGEVTEDPNYYAGWLAEEDD